MHWAAPTTETYPALNVHSAMTEKLCFSGWWVSELLGVCCTSVQLCPLFSNLFPPTSKSPKLCAP